MNRQRKTEETMNTHTETCPAPTPTTLPYTNGFGYWYLTVKQARQAAAAAVIASKIT
ncbi:MAG: hypothetical protein JW384_02390 [Nitrosomonadaceae bacterium]|nr:hypothetical protein [Nitrosomonadaceae bacterium]